MKTIEKIVIAGVVGTSFMTLYSYWKSKKENQEYVEPVMLNKLIDKSENMPDIKDNDSHPAGWGLHYLAGIAFVTAYWLMWRRALKHPTAPKVLAVGSLSGIVGIATWKLMFAKHNNPPQNYRYGYYKQLFTAHLVFSLTALIAYKLTEEKENATR